MGVNLNSPAINGWVYDDGLTWLFVNAVFNACQLAWISTATNAIVAVPGPAASATASRAATTAALLGVTYATSSDQNPAIKNFYLNRPQNVYEFAQQGERYDQLAEKMFQQEYKPLFPGRHFPTTMPEYKPQMQEMQQQIGNDLYQFKVI